MTNMMVFPVNYGKIALATSIPEVFGNMLVNDNAVLWFPPLHFVMGSMKHDHGVNVQLPCN